MFLLLKSFDIDTIETQSKTPPFQPEHISSYQPVATFSNKSLRPQSHDQHADERTIPKLVAITQNEGMNF